MQSSPNAGLVGDPDFRSKLSTPALAVDLDAMERNMKTMAALAKKHKLALRPHGKAHKSPRIAKLQIAGGAVGVCCATIGEAEVMSAGGIEDILVTAPLPSPGKLARLSRLLAAVPRLAVVVDLPETVEQMAAFTKGAKHTLTVFIDVDVGQRRTGVTEHATALEIAKRIAGSQGMKLGGLQGYAGNLQSVVAYDERLAKCREVHDKLRALKQALEAAGYACPVVTGVGTGTLLADATGGVFTEIQPGSYLYMDAQYSGVEISKEDPHPFHTGLRLFTRIISAPHAGTATTDAGHKSMPADGPAAPKVVAGAPGDTVYKYAGDEFGRLEYADKAFRAEVGALIECHVPHCDTAMAVHDHLLGIRDGKLEAVWPIEARGAW